jgi:WhiB family redox-sensing transcriptional regulator
MNSYDYNEVARVARQAILDGRSAALAIAAHYGIEESNARHVVTKARGRGHDIPYVRQGGARIVEPRQVVEFEYSREPWMQFSACKDMDPNLFFPSRGQDWTQAKKVCDSCPCKKACLDYALRLELKHGIFGGTSEAQRRPMRREYKRNWRERVA